MERKDNRGPMAAERHPRGIPAMLARVRKLLGGAGGGSSLEAAFGQLEIGVLEALWRREGKCAVADIRGDFPRIAYTTVMTTLDRLYKKSVLERHKRGRAYVYRPRYTRAELSARLAREAFEMLLAEGTAGAARPLLSTFVETVNEHDAALLDELERLIRAKRREGSS